MNMEELCTACLCEGRTLSTVSHSGVLDVFLQILHEIPYSTPVVRVCFECRAHLYKFQRFKELVKYSHWEMTHLLLYQKPPSKLVPKPSRLQVFQTALLQYPEDTTEVKVEFDTNNPPGTPVKSEPDNDISDNVDTHYSEPETFVDKLADVNTEEVPKKPKKTKKKRGRPRKKVEELNNKIKKKKEGESKIDCEFKCADCIVIFDNEEQLLQHIDVLHSKLAGEHECDICKCRYRDKNQLASHMKSHSRVTTDTTDTDADSDRKYKCDTCGVVSGSLSKHHNHISREHQERPQCPQCNKTFSSRKTYKYHLNVIHKGQNRYPCPQCGKVYQWKSNLWRHIKNHKARDSGELYCSECDKRFSSVATYQQHLKISRRHVTEEDYSFMCSECGKKFVSKTRLKDHVAWEHLQKHNYKCPLCEKPFKSNTSLYVHLRNVHRDKQERDNLCHVCGKSYQNTAKLNYHILALHSGESPYKCARCPAHFSWYSSLYRHVREVHDKIKVKKNRKSLGPSLPAPLSNIKIDKSAVGASAFI